MEFNLEKPTADEIARHFSAAMDSVNLIVEFNKKTKLTADEQDSIQRNKEHLKIVIARGWFSEEQKTALAAVL